MLFRNRYTFLHQVRNTLSTIVCKFNSILSFHLKMYSNRTCTYSYSFVFFWDMFQWSNCSGGRQFINSAASAGVTIQTITYRCVIQNDKLKIIIMIIMVLLYLLILYTWRFIYNMYMNTSLILITTSTKSNRLCHSAHCIVQCTRGSKKLARASHSVHCLPACHHHHHHHHSSRDRCI